MRKTLLTIAACLALMSGSAFAQTMRHDAPGAANPVIPGYFADPTVKKFGDTFYMYATTDGSGAGFGPAQVWVSKDFMNWTLMPMNWPDTHWIWAPDCMQHTDGKYYFYYCQPCTIHGGVSETPRGPWTNLLGESDAVMIEDRFVFNAITLDGQTFVDDDGSVYMYWGTWGIYKGFGCGSGKLNPDMKSFSETRLIPNTEVVDFFEAPFVLKRNGIYYFMYSSDSCHDHTYHVQYATAEHPLGPYTYKGTILESNADFTVDGPGHHSVLQDGDDYYIVYHRHDNPHSNRGFHRQLCIDKMEFDEEGNIKKVVPTHEGIGFLAPSVVKSGNLAYQCKVKASSYYDDFFKPEFAVDDNNGTLWRPRGMNQEWIELDLGKVQKIQTIWTQFEYGTQFYQYLIETSKDGKTWDIYADKRDNRLAGSPMVDFGNVKARYVRITTTGGQKVGFNGAIWNVKVYGGIEEANPQQWVGVTAADWNGREWKNNEGMLGGSFVIEKGQVNTGRFAGRDAVILEPNTVLTFKNAHVSPSKEHTLSAMSFKNGEWTSYDPVLTDGKIEIKSGDEKLIVTNVRYYNWKQDKFETEYDLKTDIVRMPVADWNKKGLLVDIEADVFEAGDTLYWGFDNLGTLGGSFTPTMMRRDAPAIVKEIDGKLGIHFTGSQVFQSDFAMPATVRDNVPYTLEAWILNEEIALNECVADFTSSHDELEKIMFVNGTEPRCGVMNHYAWYEDAGWADVKNLEGKWQHIYVCFDGRIEQVWINDMLVSEKDIQLLVKPSQYVLLGRNAEHDWPFTGYLNSLKFWDEYIPYKK